MGTCADSANFRSSTVFGAIMDVVDGPDIAHIYKCGKSQDRSPRRHWG